MKIRILLSIIALSTTLLSFGCGDDNNSTNPPKTEPSFTFPAGSYWVYNNYSLDANNKRDESSKTVDSIVVTGTKQLFGKTATILTSYSNGESADKYYAAEGKKLYATSSLVSPGANLPIPLNIPVDTWFLVADYDQNEWTIFTQPFDKQPVNIGGIDGLLTGTFKIICKKVTSQTIKWGMNEDKDLSATDFQLIYNFEGKINVTIDKNLNFAIKVHFWHNPDGGIVKNKMESTKVGIPNIYETIINGNETVMLSYLFNK